MGSKHADIDALILNSPYLAPLDTSTAESVLFNMMIKMGFSKDMDDKYEGLILFKNFSFIYTRVLVGTVDRFISPVEVNGNSIALRNLSIKSDYMADHLVLFVKHKN